ncbi:MAG: hypothetical protein ACREP7_20605 [Lysobacter sp.]
MRPYQGLSLSIAAMALALAVTACGGKDPATGENAQGEAGQSLPAPEGGAGGVTGMPDKPGPGQVGGPVEAAPAQPALDENGNPLPVAGENASPAEGAANADGAAAGSTEANPAATATEPTAEDAAAVIRDYYASINGKNFEHAYAQWSDGGRASGQDPQQFANGFAQTAGVSVEVMPPGRVDAGAGQRYVEIPVAITATQRDGSQRKYIGGYTLRRTVVDGASAEQRAWHIASADIREVKP